MSKCNSNAKAEDEFAQTLTFISSRCLSSFEQRCDCEEEAVLRVIYRASPASMYVLPVNSVKKFYCIRHITTVPSEIPNYFVTNSVEVTVLLGGYKRDKQDELYQAIQEHISVCFPLARIKNVL